MLPTENDKPLTPEKPVTPDEKKLASFIIQGLFVVGLVVCIFIDSMNDTYALPLVVYTILGAGSIGTENFLRLVNAVRGKQ